MGYLGLFDGGIPRVSKDGTLERTHHCIIEIFARNPKILTTFDSPTDKMCFPQVFGNSFFVFCAWSFVCQAPRTKNKALNAKIKLPKIALLAD